MGQDIKSEKITTSNFQLKLLVVIFAGGEHAAKIAKLLRVISVEN